MLTYHIEQKDHGVIVYLNGELDHHYTLELRTKIDDLLEHESIHSLIFDFGGLVFMDSSGIGLILGRYNKLKLSGGTVSVRNLTPSVKRLVEVSGLKKVIPIIEERSLCS